MKSTIHELKSEVKKLKDKLHDFKPFTRGCFKAGAGKKSAQDIILENFFIYGDKNAVTGLRLDMANQIITLRNLNIRDCLKAGIEAENNSCVNVFDSLRIRDCGSGVNLLQK